ncbi:MAG: multidrug effflux MFS transporter [Deltaproteobacteria bacterium]|jgi:DHA1 family bicyclomycin/chloramphenicol resistance-like MFS transporter|nr:multidrug effflux MFS transporter [Deltaproteobacteria bacterium]
MLPTRRTKVRPRRHTASLSVLLGILVAFAPFSTDMYLAAFPEMALDMGTQIISIQLTLSVFFFGLGIGQLIYGPLSDSFGRRKPLFAGLTLYTLATLAMVYVRDIDMFLCLRFLQAVGGCSGMIICRAVVRDCYDLEGSAKIFTVIMAIQSIGPVVAPVVGAYLIAISNWSSCFIFMTLLGLSCLIFSFFVLKETLPRKQRINLNIKNVFTALWRLCRKRDFILVALAGAFGNASIFSFISASPKVLMGTYGLSVTQYGWTFGLFSLAIALVSQFNFLFLKKFTARMILAAGLFFTFFFGGVTTLFTEIYGLPNAAIILILLFLSLTSLPLIAANYTALAMAESGKTIGSASSLIGILQFLTAGAVAYLVGASEDFVTFPMSFLIMCCGFIGLILVAIGKIRTALERKGY